MLTYRKGRGRLHYRCPPPLFLIGINSMPNYMVILHASHNLSFSFTITFTFNDNKTIVEIRYNADDNIFDV